MKHLTPIQRFRRLIAADRKEIGRVYYYAIFHGLVNLSIPLGIQAIVNLIQGGQVSTSWIVLVVVVVLGVLLTGGLQLAQMRIIETLQQRIFSRAAFEFTYRLPKFKASVIDRDSAPELMNRFFDTVSVQKGMSKVLLDFSTATLQIIFGLILLSFYHPFFIIFGLGLFMLVLAIFKYTGINGLKTSLSESKYKYRVVSWLEDIARTRLSFKLAPHSDLHMQRTDDNVLGYLQSRESHFKVLRHQYILLIVFKSLVAAGLLLIGGLLVLNQQMNIGQFIAAEIIILLVINSVEKLILSIENVYDVITALEKIGYVTDMEVDSTERGSQVITNKAPASVEVINLSFTHPGAASPVIKHFSMKVQPGQHTCLTGHSGSGKTSMLYLLSGIYKAETGTICINDLPMANYRTSDLYQHIGIRLNQEQIFNGSLLENITLGRPGINNLDILEAAEITRLKDFIQQLPEGLDTMLGVDGIKLPKSVVQKILLARSIVHKPVLLLVENGMEFLEEHDRKAIISALTSQNQPWTLICSSVNNDIINACQQIIDIQKPE